MFTIRNFSVWLLLLRKKIHLQTAVILDTILSFSKVWDKEINEKVVWPKISGTMKRLTPFLNFNVTEAKMIMKDVFLNE